MGRPLCVFGKKLFPKEKKKLLAQDKLKDRIEKLYGKYLSGIISRNEFEELYELIQDKSNHEWLEQYIESTMPGHTIPVMDLLADSHPDDSPSLISRRSVFVRIAAAAAVLLLIAVPFFTPRANSPEWTVYTTGYQETRTIELPDGSSVVLNASSELKWNNDYEMDESRVLELKGEAFFDVVQLKDKRFTVHTGTVDVKVLGTQFNLETRRDYTNIFLKEGKVVLETENLQTIEMEPGDLVHYDVHKKQAQKVSDQPADPALSWKDGVFTFTTLTGIQILEKMEDIYGKEFIIEDAHRLSDVIVVQGLPYTDWDFTREALELALEVRFVDSTANNIIVKEK